MLGFITKMLGGGVVNAAGGIADIIDKFVETDEEKAAAKIILMKTTQEPDKWQALTNQIEAKHRSMFVAGWRPAVGWICVLALFWGWILAPTLVFFYPNSSMPAIEIGQAISLVMALLGMGALRSYEKKEGLTK